VLGQAKGSGGGGWVGSAPKRVEVWTTHPRIKLESGEVWVVIHVSEALNTEINSLGWRAGWLGH
jgi:hypothetical protein